MRSLTVIALGLALTASVAQARSSAGATAMKGCALQWEAKKAANQTNGESYRDFSKSCLSSQKAAVTTTTSVAPTPTQPAPAPAQPAKPSILSRIMRHTSTSTTSTNSASTNGPAVVAGPVASYSGKSITTSPAGATGQCKDGTYTHATHHSGACSSHGGVAKWM